MDNVSKVETHKIAKVGKDFLVAHPKEGWLNAAGKVTRVSASPKRTQFIDNEADAKALGFSPSEVQKAALAAWPKPPQTPAAK